MRRIALALIAVSAILLYACGRAPSPEPGTPGYLPARWDGAQGGASWTTAALFALETHGAPLVKMVPTDIQDYCPRYEAAGVQSRKAFWVNLLASLSFHESTWNPNASGGDGRWHGLLQIAPATARGYGCQAGDADRLKDGALNVSCGLRIMAVTVPRDGVISAGMRGVAADWGPFHQPRKRNEIQSFTKSLPYCRK
ncbi:MAG: transglycosylase SLT domain-containing protein [Boseongicola sp.]